ncbi:MAG TPA: hypothetical protein P5526_27005 [Anaerolineae bacterium]|nr:hypothetical protein [Anaerolineae bacterium]MCB0180720.1 hypothetical protein [Anaerolineae bacterium]MCB9106524.1 hypothetical protein [Anaerolineales bacterium]HRV95833.1 hypothetical protein [Anaerolineae bacterium]
MLANSLSLQEVEDRRQRLTQELRDDQVALNAGFLDKSEAIKRSVYREFEQRWLEMEALLLQSNSIATK